MQWHLRRDSSSVRALVRITRGPGFDPQSRCLNFSASPSRFQCFLLTGEKRMVLSEVSDWDILIHNHFQLTGHVIFNQNVSPGMPLASSLDKGEITEIVPFIQALPYRHNDFWHSYLIHAKPTYNIVSFHTSTHYGYPYTP